MTIKIANSLTEIAAEQWNNLDLQGNPLLRHEFLLALEQTNCATHQTGWQPQHLSLTNSNGELIGAVPLYLKPHSWGEFVFDWSWANAYAQLGRDYYPKLLSTVPFTPASGSRLLVAKSCANDSKAIRNTLIDALLALVKDLNLSSAHILFTTQEEQLLLEERGFIARCDCQFHWRNNNYTSFDDFIATFRAEKRKKALRERRRVAEAGITFDTLTGAQMSPKQWQVAMQFSENTFHSHGHEHYLNLEFLCSIANTLPDALMVKFAKLNDEYVAAAIFFQSADTLYGRYWGAAADFHSLHFETCYFQGIDYCIRRGLKRFEPGTQGEHKIARGFAPAKTWSAHWIADTQLARAIRIHTEQERAAVDHYIGSVEEHLPFHRNSAAHDATVTN